MKWPWRKTPTPEKRSGQGFSDTIIAGILSQTGGAASSGVVTTGVVEQCAQAYATAFEACTVHASDMVKKVLTPSLLGNVARTIVSTGSAMYLIEIVSGEIKLRPVGSWDISGGGTDPSGWMVRADTYSPSSTDTVYTSYNSVLHFLHHYNPSRPWLGLSGMDTASTTAGLAANLETRLKQEASAASGAFLPWPSSPSDEDADDDAATPGPMVALQQDVSKAQGKLVIVETVNSGHGDKQSAPAKDLVQSRFGFDAPDTMRALRKDVAETVMNVLGVPAPLLTADANSQAQRESWRRFILSSCTGLAGKISDQLSLKLDDEVRLSFEGLYAHDVQGRAASFKAMTVGGMDIEKAAALSGLLGMEED